MSQSLSLFRPLAFLKKPSTEALQGLLQKARSSTATDFALLEETAQEFTESLKGKAGHLKQVGKSKSSPSDIGLPQGRARLDSKEKIDPFKSGSEPEPEFVGFPHSGRADSTTPNGSPSSPAKSKECRKPDGKKPDNVKRKLFAEENLGPLAEETSTEGCCPIQPLQHPSIPYQLAEQLPGPHPYIMQTRSTHTLAAQHYDMVPTKYIVPMWQIRFLAQEIFDTMSIKAACKLAGPTYKLIDIVKAIRTGIFGESLASLKSLDNALHAQSKIHPAMLQQVLSGPAEFISQNGAEATLNLLNCLKFIGITGFGLYGIAFAQPLDSEGEIVSSVTKGLASDSGSIAATGGPNSGNNSPVPSSDGSEFAITHRDEDPTYKPTGACSLQEKGLVLLMMLACDGSGTGTKEANASPDQPVHALGDVGMQFALCAEV